MKTKNAGSNARPSIHQTKLYNLLFVPLALLALYVLVPQLGQFDSAFHAAQSADVLRIIVAGFCIVGAVLAAAAVYVFLAQRPIQYRQSALVQTAGMFVNRLLPAGIGGMGLSADFLYRQKHTVARAAAIVALNNTLTFLGHMLLLGLVLAVGVAELPTFSLPAPPLWIIASVAAVSLVGLSVVRIQLLRRFQSFLVDFVRALALYRTQKQRVLLALCFALCNTLAHATALLLCMQAFNLDLSIGVALVALTGGVAVASVTPTPGGLFGSEAGLTAVLVSYDVPAGTALAVALSYRLVSYWIPLLPGAIAFWYAGQRRII